MKLRYKFFTVFLLTSLLIVALFVGILQVVVYGNFAQFVNQTELDKMDGLVQALAGEYQRENGWELFERDPRNWDRILFQNLSVNQKQFRGEPAFRPSDGPKPFGRLRPGFYGHRRPGPGLRRPFKEDAALGRGLRLCLYDKEKQHVAGPLRPTKNVTYRSIRIDGETVGWLGLQTAEEMYPPLGVAFLKSQKNAFYLMGLGIFILTAIISYVLSKHLLSPVQELVKGTKAMTSFDFDMKIDVRSKDELGRLADDFNRMAQTLKAYEEMRKQWISDISHELRTPITILRGKIEAVQDGIRGITPETMDSLHGDVIRLGKLVDDLHLLSMADSRSLRMEKKQIQPLHIIREILDTFTVQLARQEIGIEAAFPKNNSLFMHGDPDQLGRLFSNLIENTLRYTDSPGNLKISLTHDHTWMTIRFEDSAPGVPNEALPKVFNRLYRADSSRNRALGGSGLGLSICKQIVENHQGKIVSEHSMLGGLMITIGFPLQKKEQE